MTKLYTTVIEYCAQCPNFGIGYGGEICSKIPGSGYDISKASEIILDDCPLPDTMKRDKKQPWISECHVCGFKTAFAPCCPCPEIEGMKGEDNGK